MANKGSAALITFIIFIILLIFLSSSISGESQNLNEEKNVIFLNNPPQKSYDLNLRDLSSIDDSNFSKETLENNSENVHSLAKVSSGKEIRFNPDLPSSVCEGEKLTIGVMGEVPFTSRGLLLCGPLSFGNGYNFRIRVRIMEADTWSSDDLISETYLTIHTACSSAKDVYLPYSYTFKNIDLASQFGGAEDQGTLEIYAIVEPNDNDDPLTYEARTKEYDVDKNKNCQCISGSCCNLETHRFLSDGSQPKGYESEYICSAQNSPSGTNHLGRRDYVCDGKGNVVSSTSTIDRCGICNYCSPDSASCLPYSRGTKYGTKDCDYLDTKCRDYEDVSLTCNGRGGTTSPSCNSYTDKPKNTPCGTNALCDGNGKCVTQNTQASYKCYDDDVYWYDNLGNREDKKEECGTNEDISKGSTCVGNDLWETRTLVERGCSGGNCFTNYDDYNAEKIQTCQYKCNVIGQNARCESNPNIKCNSDVDCKKTGYDGAPFCYGGNVHRYQILNYSCENPGTKDSYCDYSTRDVLIEDCWGVGCQDGECGKPKKSACSLDSDCGTISWLHSKMCREGDVWMVGTGPKCINPGAEASYCDKGNYFGSRKKEECGENGWGDNYCYDNDVYHDYFSKGCRINSFTCYSNIWKKEKVQECGDAGCENGACKGTPNLKGDFNENSVIDFPDFLMFAQNYGKDDSMQDFDTRFDLIENGAIDFQDFIEFARNYGKTKSGKTVATKPISIKALNR